MVSSVYFQEDLKVSAPDIIQVLADSRSQEVIKQLSRVHSIVLGPGLGRDVIAIEVAKRVIAAVVAQNLPLVIDADGLWLLSQNLSIIKG